MMRLVLASNNAGKLRELRALLTPLGVELIAQAELGIGDADETAVTFLENALIKARHAATGSDLPALADDSGLVVPALGGAPGVHSARYAGAGATDADNNAKLIAALTDSDDRSAYYYCALVYVRATDDPAPLLATGRWHGHIVASPRGENGFGYDPFFAVRELASDDAAPTAAQLDPAHKNRLSHRGQACARLLEQLADELGAAPAANAPRAS